METLLQYRKVIIVLSTVVWLAFIFAAFRGFHFWYAGFVFFLWLSLGVFNYKEKTSFWLINDSIKTAIRFYIYLVIISFVGDFIMGQNLTHLWSYPFYKSLDAWLRLYFIIYPFGGLAVLELSYFLCNIFGEKLVFVRKPYNLFHKLVDYADGLLLFAILIFTLLAIAGIKIGSFNHLIIYSLFTWAVIGTLKFKLHISHWFHYVAILVVTLLISLFLHEIPNVGTFEWQYNDGPFLNQNILGIRLWVVAGWYIIVLGMVRAWMHVVLHPNQK